MKTIIGLILIGMTSAISADLSTTVKETRVDTASNAIIPEMKPLSFEEKPIAKPAFFYIRFAAAESDITQINSLAPGLGIGYRRLAGDGAADISVSGIGYAEKKSGRIFWTAPKASYIHYFQPDKKESFYLGGGLAWGGLESKKESGFKKHDFIGLIPSATAGYEFVRKSTVLGFTELNISQPTLAVSNKGIFPGPIIECTLGIGF